MFAWEMYSGATPFSENENKFIKRYLEICQHECSRDAAFMNQLDLKNLEFNWAPNMTSENGIMGAWAMTSPNKVFLMAYQNPCADEEKPEEIPFALQPKDGSEVKDAVGLAHVQWVSTDALAMTVVHELVHKFQFQTAPFLYCINRLVTLFVDHIPVLERIGIEYDARKNSETEELKEFYSLMGTCIGMVSNAALWGPMDPKVNRHLKYLLEPTVDEATGEVYPIPYDIKYVNYAIELVKIFF